MKSLSITWLGQSGFLIEVPEIRIACDLYLSDFCRKKSKLDHTRLMPVPIAPEDLESIDHYLITHDHIDHLDPETIGPILETNSETKFYCPPVCNTAITEYFKEKSFRFEFLHSLKEYIFAPGIRFFALPAAHEKLEKDSFGEYKAFGYLLLFDSLKKTVFISGDTIPYEGQADLIRKHIPFGYELTLILPVNGRDEERANLGVKGNLTAKEAIQFFHDCQADLLIPCHFGMFAFNDPKTPITPEYFEERNCSVSVPELNQSIKL